MLKIATHNSATGEKAGDILSWIITPFSKTQSKTINEQYKAGCRMFDFRVRRSRTTNQWVCAHGLWESKVTIFDLLDYLNSYNDVYVTITYEGKESKDFIHLIKYLEKTYLFIEFGGIAYKYAPDDGLTKVSYNYIKPFPSNWPECESNFLQLDGRSWHTYLPIPWLWKKIYYNTNVFNDKYFTYVDFL